MKSGNELSLHPIPDFEPFFFCREALARLHRWPASVKDVAYYHHSSGTSGLPKLLPVTHRMAIGVLPGIQPGPLAGATFSTTPMYHGGPADCFRAWAAASLIWLYPGQLPVTGSLIEQCLAATRNAFTERNFPCDTHVPDLAYFSCVPQVLASLVEHPTALTVIKDRTEMIGVGGAAMPEQLGNDLVRRGVNLVSRFGSTECGFLLSSHRQYDIDKEWQYLRHDPMVESIVFELRENGLFELIALNSWPALVKTNRPDGSYATSDLFEPHPMIPNAWKYHSRTDSQITLVTGKKFDPVPSEDRLRESPLLDDVLIFGTNHHLPGAILFPSAKASVMPKEEFISSVWKLVQAQNARVPKYAQLTRSMLKRVSNPGPGLPKSSKGTTLRPKAEALCQQEIELAYSSEQKSDDLADFDPSLNDNEVTQQLHNIVKGVKGESLDIAATDDLFNQGVDSIDCIKIISGIQKSLLPPDSQTLPIDVVYTCGNIARLALHVISLRKGTAGDEDDEAPRLWELVSKYGTWKLDTSQDSGTQQSTVTLDIKQVILLTGATGTLGAHILSQLRAMTSVGEIHCLVRAKDDATAQKRLQASLSHRQLPPLKYSCIKIFSYPCELSQLHLGLTEEAFETLANRVTHVIHAAWPVNFSLRLQSFVKESLGGLHNLINFALVSNRTTPAHFVFCSSTASVLQSQNDRNIIPEEICSDASKLSPMGYAQSKWVAEQICNNAHQNTHLHNSISVVRIGQLCGDTRHGIWNETEAFPLMISSSKATGSFPQLPPEPLQWLPFDVAAAAVLDISIGATKEPSDSCRVYNLLETSPKPTTVDLANWVENVSPKTKIVSPGEWLSQLQQLKDAESGHPALKLLAFWQQAYAGKGPEKAQVVTFAIEETLKVSLAMREHDPIGAELFQKIRGWVDENVGQ